MSRLPMLTASRVIRTLEKAGLLVVRIKGSHHIMVHPADPTKRTTVPLHKGQDLPRSLVRKILADVRMTEDEFRNLL